MLGEEIKTLRDKVAIITGGTTGIGRATAILLARNGAEVIIFGRHQDKLDAALRDIKKISGRAEGMIADVSESSDIERVFGFADRAFGRLDILINNASLPAETIMNYSPKEIDYIVKTNILGYLLCSREAVNRMKNRGGHIINIGSLSAKYEEKGASLYVAGKAAVAGFSESLRKEANPLGIKVSLVEPGAVGTDMVEEAPEAQRSKEEAGKMLKAEDVAAAVCFCLTMPDRAEVMKIQIKPKRQEI